MGKCKCKYWLYSTTWNSGTSRKKTFQCQLSLNPYSNFSSHQSNIFSTSADLTANQNRIRARVTGFNFLPSGFSNWWGLKGAFIQTVFVSQSENEFFWWGHAWKKGTLLEVNDEPNWTVLPKVSGLKSNQTVTHINVQGS